MLKTKLKTKKSEELYEKACAVIPGGVNSPVRSFKSVGGNPIYFEKGDKQYLFDVDGNKYIDFVNSWGALIHGHKNPNTTKAIEHALKNGISFGACHEAELKLAELITSKVPSIDKVRLVNSGTEAVMTALRLAKGYTKRNKIIKFSGCYHGHSDSVLSMGGSGLATLGIPSSKGVSKSTAADTITLPYNNQNVLEITLCKYPKDIAAIILEPIVGNAGVIKPSVDFLKKLREVSTRFGVVLIFDEVMTGFRTSPCTAQEKFDVIPDLTVLGKIIGGGLPIGAVGGKSEIMDLLAPNGSVYQAGTLSGNPIAVAAGISTLEQIDKGTLQELELKTEDLCQNLININNECGKDIQISNIGSMFSIFFCRDEVHNFEDAKAASSEAFSAFYHKMLEKGVYLAPSQFEANFVSTELTEKDIKQFVAAYKEAIN